MLIENALLLSGLREKHGRFYYISGYGRTVRPYAKEFGYTVYDYRKYLLYANFINGELRYNSLHDDIFGYMNTVESAGGDYDSSEYCTLNKYFKPGIHESPVKLNNQNCILIYPDKSNTNLWLIWQPSKDLLDFVEYDEDEFQMADVRVSDAYEKRYGEINPALLKSLKNFNGAGVNA